MAQSDFSTLLEDMIMDSELNPFHDLYVTETTASRPNEFVQLFSPFLIKNALLLFEPINVVLKGTQGSGKSMLLNLLKPEIRLAYHEAGESFPVPLRVQRFLSAGVNLTRCGATDIGQRPLSRDPQDDMRLFPLYFADFLNYWIVRDILASVLLMSRNSGVFPFILHPDRLDEFARDLASQECWFGYLDGASGCEEVRNRLSARIMWYRKFHQFNLKELPTDIHETKTVVGQPISTTVECLTRFGILEDNVPVLVRIDQHEILCRSDDIRNELGVEYRRVINKALSTRDPHVFYRIGTRRYAWEDDLTVFGTTSPLEWERDYKIIDLDDLLRRKEDRTLGWVFPGFARDVFRRRLERANLTNNTDENLLQKVMGTSPKSKDLARRYVGTSAARRALDVDDSWPPEWTRFLEETFDSDPLEAKLAVAWALQQEHRGKSRREAPPPLDTRPWSSRKYWRKERLRQALFQLAASCGQRPLWWGEENVLSLSMGSILVFVSVCQHIWDTFFRFERGKGRDERSNPLVEGIEPDVQAIAIQTASTRWYNKIAVEEAGGNDRQRFIDFVGRLIQTRLYNDKSMSYPGHNGFSLRADEYQEKQSVHDFLADAVDYGDLYDAPHTTKEKDRRQRIKWYLHPILSPHFRIPESHIKEPMYVTVSDVLSWIDEARIVLRGKSQDRENTAQYVTDQQLSLFSERED